MSAPIAGASALGPPPGPETEPTREALLAALAERDRELAEARARQAATAEILRVISQSPTDARPVFESIVLTAVRLLGCSIAAVMLREGGDFEVVAAASPTGVYTPKTPRMPVDPAANFPSRAIVSKETLYLPDWSLIDLPEQERNVRELFGANCSLFLPLLRQGECFGLLTLVTQRANAFGPSEVALAESFRDQSLIAIENARLFNETQEALERQTATAEILKVIASSPSDVQPVFEAIAASAKRLLGGYSAVVGHFVGEWMHLVAFTPIDPDADAALKALYPIRRLPADSPFGETLLRQGFSEIADTEAAHYPEIRASGRVRGIRSWLVALLRVEGEPFGWITVARKETGRFAPQDIQLLLTFADQASIAVQNARLFNETKEALERQTATADILKVIASSPSDVQPVFDAIARSANSLLGGFFSAVYRFVGDALHLAGFTSISPAADEALQSSFPRPIADLPHLELLGAGATVELADIEAEPGLATLTRDLARSRGYRSSLMTPLISGDAPIGMIVVNRKATGEFSPHHVQLLRTFADQAMIAIQNVKLFNETKEALERQTATAEILKVIAGSPSDAQPVFEAIAESANRLLRGHSTNVTRYIGDMSHLAAFTPIDPEADAVLVAAYPRPLANNAIFAATRLGRAFQLQDIEVADPLGMRELARRRGWRSLAVAPLSSHGTAIGGIAVTRSTPGAFAEDDVQLLQTFADQAVIAIENARLLNETREALEQQKASADVLGVIGKSVSDAAPVFDAILSACHRLFGSDEIGIYTVGDDNMVRVAAWRGPRAAEVRNDVTPLADSVTGRIIRERRTHHIPDLLAEPDLSATIRERAMRLGSASLLYAPMRWEDSGLGSILVVRSPPKPFSDREKALLQSFADQAAIAIQNARLFQETQARTRELSASLDDLRKAQDRLVQTQKLASLGQLTAGIAHEIKNPLNFVNNFSALSAELIDELLEALAPAKLDAGVRGEVDELTKMLKDNLQKVVQHGRRADSIVKNMLLHSREGSGERRLADINAILDESLNLAYHGARAEKSEFNITLQRDFDAGAGSIEVYPQEISRAFLNLISNGFYAAIKRKAELSDSGFEPLLSATTRSLGDAVEICIRDNGTGIPAEAREKIFNPFFTTKPAGEGTGLGLSMSHDIIVKQHGGVIDVATAPGEFTEFTIRLPRGGALGEKDGGRI